MPGTYTSELHWSGAVKGATVDPKTFSRDLAVSFDSESLAMSAAPEFSGDPRRVNPEELLVAAVSACQALTYLFLAARKGLRVVGYSDRAEGHLAQVDGRSQMVSFVLRPVIELEAGGDVTLAHALIEKAHEHCIVASSLKATVEIEPLFDVRQPAASCCGSV